MPRRPAAAAAVKSLNNRLLLRCCCPPQDGTRPDLLATSGDFLRLWRVSDDPGAAQQGVRLEKLLNNVRFV